MFIQAILRGSSDTWRFARARIVTSVISVIGVFICASVARYYMFGREMMLSEWQVAFSGLLGVGLFLSIALLWNIACAPYRIERDKRRSIEAQVESAEDEASSIVQLDWTFKDLILHVDPFVMRPRNPDEPEPLREAEKQILDQASLGNLRVWGRKYDESGMDDMMGITHPLVPIPKERWAEFYLDHTAFWDDRNSNEAHVSAIDTLSGPRFSDLRVSSENAKKIWRDINSTSVVGFEAIVSILGIHSITKGSKKSVRDICSDRPLPAHEVDVFFARPMPRRYTVIVESNETAFRSVLEEAPQKCRLRLQGPTAAEHLVSIRFSLLNEAWESQSQSDTEEETPQ